MARNHLLLFVLTLWLPAELGAQMTMVFNNRLSAYNRGLELYEKQKFGAAQEQFQLASGQIEDPNSELRANADFYIAACALELFHKDAEFKFKEFIRIHSTSTRVPEAWFMLGNFNYRKKDYKRAVEFYREVEPGQLDNVRASELLFKSGYAHFQLKQWDDAANAFYKMNDQSSAYYASGVYYLGHINYQQGKYSTALKSFQSLEQHELFSTVVPYYIVQIYHFQKDFDRVISYGGQFLQRKDVKRQAEISRLVGEALYNRGKFSDAIPHLEEYMKDRSAREKDDYYVLGMCYFKAERYDDATEPFSKISYTDDLMAQNALYHMGEAYLRTDKKSYARNAFKSAARLTHDPQLREDALFKYAQLSYELSYDPYDGAIAAFKEYISEYPNRDRTQEAYNYLVNIYLTSKNYDAALASIEEYKDPDLRLKEAYQRIALNKGIQLFKEKNYKSALGYFERSLRFTQNKITASEAAYWKAESLYYQGMYSKATKAYEDFIYSPGAALTEYFNLANYNIGYCYFQMSKYVEAPQWFRRYLSVKGEVDAKRTCDANLRTGDCYYMLKQYDAAKIYYTDAVNSGASDKDYAQYQLAMTTGFLGNHNEKLAMLDALVSSQTKSRYLDAAHYEIGRIHIMQNRDEQALASMNKVVSDFPGSSYVRRALVSIGQTYYNAGKDDEALAVFMRILKDYPTYNDTREAIIGIKNIYVDKGKSEDFESLIASLPFVNFSEAARDSLAFESADKLYADGNCREAVEGFSKYLQRFEKPLFASNARFYRGECLLKMDRIEEAMVDFLHVAELPQNAFSETSLLRIARHAFAAQKFPEALAYYKRLSLLGQYKNNLLEAEVGMMRCNFILNNMQGAISYAMSVLESDKVDPNLVNEAQLVIARANIKLNNPKEARPYLDKVSKSGIPSHAAEALYLHAEIYLHEDQLDSTEALVFRLVSNFRSEAYWVARALVLLSDVYVTRGDLFQATTTLQSVLDNYKPEDDAKTTARDKMKNIQSFQIQETDTDNSDYEMYLDDNYNPNNN